MRIFNFFKTTILSFKIYRLKQKRNHYIRQVQITKEKASKLLSNIDFFENEVQSTNIINISLIQYIESLKQEYLSLLKLLTRFESRCKIIEEDFSKLKEELKHL